MSKPKKSAAHSGKKVHFDVVGIHHRVTMDTRRMMVPHLPLGVKLVREPDNFADHNAIKVVIDDAGSSYNGLHIGYLRRDVAEVYAPVMDQGEVTITEAWLTKLRLDQGEGDLLGWLERKSSGNKRSRRRKAKSA